LNDENQDPDESAVLPDDKQNENDGSHCGPFTPGLPGGHPFNGTSKHAALPAQL
jgi:hypothetical protein